jgi:hypothetical protein
MQLVGGQAVLIKFYWQDQLILGKGLGSADFLYNLSHIDLSNVLRALMV